MDSIELPMGDYGRFAGYLPPDVRKVHDSLLFEVGYQFYQGWLRNCKKIVDPDAEIMHHQYLGLVGVVGQKRRAEIGGVTQDGEPKPGNINDTLPHWLLTEINRKVKGLPPLDAALVNRILGGEISAN